MKKLIALALTLVLILSVLPMGAMAAQSSTGSVLSGEPSTTEKEPTQKPASKPATIVKPIKPDIKNPIFEDAPELYQAAMNRYYEVLYLWKLSNGLIEYHEHDFGMEITRDGHIYRCSCGATDGYVDPHQDPLETDGKCWCGYTYMDNADITTFWMTDIRYSPRFNKNKTEYKGKVVPYKDVTETTVTLRTFDAKATVDVEETYEIKEGTNVFAFTVTAEDGKTTKTYTFTIEK